MLIISKIWGFIIKIFSPILQPIINRIKKIFPFSSIMIKHFLPIMTILIVMIFVALIWEVLEENKVTTFISDISEGLPKLGSSNVQAAENLNASSMLDAAKKVHEYVRTNGYTYSLEVLAQTDEELTQVHSLCCATFVYWAAKEAGYKVADAPIHGADTLATALANAGFTEITDGTHQAGDVLWYPGEHIEIAAGPGEDVYNCGGNFSIQIEGDISQSYRGTASARVYRAPAK